MPAFTMPREPNHPRSWDGKGDILVSDMTQTQRDHEVR